MALNRYAIFAASFDFLTLRRASERTILTYRELLSED